MRELVASYVIDSKEENLLDMIHTPEQTMRLSRPLHLKADTTYRIQLWTDGSASLWELVADGIVGVEQ